jgi:hydrogenase expression/formation protein HypD
MNFTEEFRSEELVKTLIERINYIATDHVRIMEVCGGHTMAIRRYGIYSLLPSNIELLSGPGCPVCVTAQEFIDKAIAYAQSPEMILVTYADLLRVPGTFSSLDNEKANGADVRTIYSTLQVLEIARQNPMKKVIFAAIGFETTSPATAIALLLAKKERLFNIFVLCGHKVMPPAMEALIEEGIPIDGYIGPGHVSAVAGSKIFKPIAEKYKIPVVISGFEPVDILQSIVMLVEGIYNRKGGVGIQYSRLVTEDGNRKAQKIVEQVFTFCTQQWRGIGPIESSGLCLRKEFSRFDVEKQISIKFETGPEPKGCICGQILKGLKKPVDCPLFGKKCKPAHPVGACMVSSEGACQSYYQYKSVPI